MLFTIKNEKAYQLFALAGSALLCLALYSLFGIKPTVRIHSEMLPRVLAGGIAASFLTLFGYALIAVCRPPQMRMEFRNRFPRMSWFRIIGAAMVAGGAEELLLRGFIFAPLSTHSLFFAYFLNALLGATLSMNSRNDYAIGLLYAAQASFFAALYISTRSLFVVSLAHMLEECLTSSFRTRELFWQRLMHFRFDFRRRRNGYLSR